MEMHWVWPRVCWGNMRKHEKPTCFDTHILFQGLHRMHQHAEKHRKKIINHISLRIHVVIYTKNRNVVKI